MLALLAPGQGSQKPGFLQPWLELDGALQRLKALSELSGMDLVHLGTDAEADEIKDTANTQPLLVAASLMIAEQLPMEKVALAAGHSIGEFAAAAFSGVLTDSQAITLAAVRGKEMAKACAAEATSMAAVLGGKEDDVLAAIEAAGLTAANRNGAGQIVAAGSASGVDKLKESPPERAKVIPLQVAGAFHTHYMEPARQALSTVARDFHPADPERILLSNADGSAVSTGAEALQRLVNQVASPVRWDLCQATMSDMGVTAAIELAPAGTLAGLGKRGMKGVEFLTLNTPDDLPAAIDLINSHAQLADVDAVMEFSVTVAPSRGVFTPTEGLAPGDTISAGQSVGQIATRQGPVEVTTSHAGVVTEWLASDGDPVASGAPLIRLSPSGADR